MSLLARAYGKAGRFSLYKSSQGCYIHLAMASGPQMHRTTVDIDVPAFNGARDVLGTDGYKETINGALRAVSQSERLRRGAALIRSGEIGLTTPEELAEMRRPRVE